MGSGESIKFWEDPWVNEVPLRVSFSVDCMGCLFKKMGLLLSWVLGWVRIGSDRFFGDEVFLSGSQICWVFGQLWFGLCGGIEMTLSSKRYVPIEPVTDMITVRSWLWLKAKVKVFSSSFYSWSQQLNQVLYQC